MQCSDEEKKGSHAKCVGSLDRETRSIRCLPSWIEEDNSRLNRSSSLDDDLMSVRMRARFSSPSQLITFDHVKSSS